MKIRLVAAVVMGLSLSTSFADANNGTVTLSSDKDNLSYTIGVDLGKNFKKQGIDIAPAAMAQGLQDAMGDGKLLLTDEQMHDVLNKFQKEILAKRDAAFSKLADENKAKGDAFLAQNKGKEGVVVLPSGLQYKIVTSGSGAKPGKDDTVTVEYTGTSIDGKVFDSTEKAGKPATFKVSDVIPGWTEALQLMPAGSTWEIFVPAALAYGPRSAGNAIGPNETLVFKIHLINVKKAGA